MEEKFAKVLAMVRGMVDEGCKAKGGELRSRQVEAVIEVVTALMFGVGIQIDDLDARLARLEEVQA